MGKQTADTLESLSTGENDIICKHTLQRKVKRRGGFYGKREREEGMDNRTFVYKPSSPSWSYVASGIMSEQSPDARQFGLVAQLSS